jgi:hypothetical protein
MELQVRSRLIGNLAANILVGKAEPFLSSVESLLKSEQVLSCYTNLLPTQLKLRLQHSTNRGTRELTAVQNERTLASQSAVRRPEGVLDYNRHCVNDLPATSPHGSYSEQDARNAGLAADSDPTRGTLMTHRVFQLQQ